MRHAFMSICVLAYLASISACTGEDKTNPTKDHSAVPEKEMTSKETTVVIEEMKKPETLAERKQSRQQLANRSAAKYQRTVKAPTDETKPALGEVPSDMLAKVIKDLMAKISVAQADIDVLHAESLTFSDGSLNCSKPGMTYTQALVPGYRVILGHAGQQFDYRATRHGFFILCEQPMLPVRGTGTEPPVM